jgi:hypothetical protein
MMNHRSPRAFTKPLPGRSTTERTIQMRGWSMTARHAFQTGGWRAVTRCDHRSTATDHSGGPELRERLAPVGQVDSRTTKSSDRKTTASAARLPVWLSSAQGMVALIENNAKSAAENFQAAVTRQKVSRNSTKCASDLQAEAGVFLHPTGRRCQGGADISRTHCRFHASRRAGQSSTYCGFA